MKQSIQRLRPNYRRWLKDCEKEINKPENLDAILAAANKRWLDTITYGTSHSETESRIEPIIGIWQEIANKMDKS